MASLEPLLLPPVEHEEQKLVNEEHRQAERQLMTK